MAQQTKPKPEPPAKPKTQNKENHKENIHMVVAVVLLAISGGLLFFCAILRPILPYIMAEENKYILNIIYAFLIFTTILFLIILIFFRFIRFIYFEGMTFYASRVVFDYQNGACENVTYALVCAFSVFLIGTTASVLLAYSRVARPPRVRVLKTAGRASPSSMHV